MERADLLRYAGYNALFWLFFWVFAYWTFPYDRLGGVISNQVAAASDYRIQFGDLSPSWVTGVTLSDVKLSKAGSEDTMEIKEVTARASLWALLTGSTAVSFSAEFGDGSLDGEFENSETTQHIAAEFDDVDLAALGILDDVVPLPVAGTVVGDMELTIAEEPEQTEGFIKLTVEELAVGDGEAKLDVPGMGGLTVDKVEAGDLEVDMEVKEGIAEVKKFAADGPDLSVDGSGEVRLAKPMGRSRSDLTMKFKVKDAYKKKSSRAEAMVSMLDSGMAPQIKSAKTSDGALQFRLTGSISRPRFVPSGRSRGVRPGRGSRKSRKNRRKPKNPED